MVFHWRFISSIQKNSTTTIFATQKELKHQFHFAVKVLGSSCLIVKLSHLHDKFNFVDLNLETVGRSLLHSCRSAINRQGISLPLNCQGLQLPFIGAYIQCNYTSS